MAKDIDSRSAPSIDCTSSVLLLAAAAHASSTTAAQRMIKASFRAQKLVQRSPMPRWFKTRAMHNLVAQNLRVTQPKTAAPNFVAETSAQKIFASAVKTLASSLAIALAQKHPKT